MLLFVASSKRLFLCRVFPAMHPLASVMRTSDKEQPQIYTFFNYNVHFRSIFLSEGFKSLNYATIGPQKRTKLFLRGFVLYLLGFMQVKKKNVLVK